ncbi:hypothetical protein Tco_0137809 [Tanacetum coccineum]
MRLKTDIKPKEATFQVVLDALALTPFYQAFLITTEVPAIYFGPKIPGQKFKDLLLEHDILSFIKDLGHTRDITYLTNELTNQAILESKAYQTYYAFASGVKAPKPKYVQKKADSDTSPKKKPVQDTKGTRLKTSAKVAKSDKKKQPAKMPKAKGLNVLSEVPDEQQQKISGTNEGAGVTPEVPDVLKYDSESEEESWTFSQDEEDVKEDSDKNDDIEETESDNDRDNLTHPNLSTYNAKDQEEEKAYE